MNIGNKQHETGILMLLRICTILLAAVSFWATAQGMREYTFPTDWQAYAASLGIQGLLLGLNFSLPSFLKKSQGVFRKIVLIFLAAVVLLCSSWFSYLYIAGQAYGQSWDVERRLLAQDIYRSELFAADTYAEQYADEIERGLSEQVVELYQQAAAMGTGSVDVAQSLDLDADLDLYAPAGSAAREIMRTIVDSIRPALESNAQQDVRQLALDTIDVMQTTMQNEITSLDARIVDADARIATATSSLTNAQNRLANAPADVDITPYQNAVNTAAGAYERAIAQQSDLVRQREDYQTVLQRTGYYAGLLGMTQNGVSTYFVGANLREIQRELFGTTPDSERMLELATEVFDRLQSGIDLDSGETESTEYQQFLSQMNQFVRTLENYRAIKISSADFQKLITQLSDGQILALDGLSHRDGDGQPDDTSDGSTLPNTPEPNGEEQGDGQPDGEDQQDGALIAPEESTPTDGDDSIDGGSDDNRTSDTTPVSDKSRDDSEDSQMWETVWLEQFNTLKSKISGLPVYTKPETDADDETAVNLSFDRAASTRRLDAGIRNYLTPHNPAQEGIIYLLSPYWAIAFFSLCVALLLDISAFITGVIIDRVETSTGAPVHMVYTTAASAFDAAAGLKRYIFLTGDYQCINEVVTYRAIENGSDLEIEYSGNIILPSDFYVWDGKTVMPLLSAELLFKGSDGGPQDGVYTNATLHYEAPVLTLTQNNCNIFLGHADSQTPVYLVSKDQYEFLPVTELDDTHGGGTVVIALDRDGKVIIGVYILKL